MEKETQLGPSRVAPRLGGSYLAADRPTTSPPRTNTTRPSRISAHAPGPAGARRGQAGWNGTGAATTRPLWKTVKRPQLVWSVTGQGRSTLLTFDGERPRQSGWSTESWKAPCSESVVTPRELSGGDGVGCGRGAAPATSVTIVATPANASDRR